LRRAPAPPIPWGSTPWSALVTGGFYVPFAARYWTRLHGRPEPHEREFDPDRRADFPNILATGGTGATGSQNLFFTADKFRNPFTRQATVAIEHEFAAKTALPSSVLDSQGVSCSPPMTSTCRLRPNTVIYTIVDASGKAVNQVGVHDVYHQNDTRYGHLYSIENGGKSWYNAAMFQLRQPVSHGLTLAVNYTWSHAMDDVGNSPLGLSMDRTITTTPPTRATPRAISATA